MLFSLLVVSLSIFFVSASDVLEFTDANFKDKIVDHPIILVEFYAPWCGHCKKLAPEYEKAATELKRNDPPVPLAKVDCIAETGTCGEFGVSGYPTLKIFKNGEFSSEYNGPREADGIVKYMRSRAGPSSKKLDDIKAAKKFVGNFEHSIVGFFESEDDNLAKEFLKTADALSENYRFAHTFSSEVASGLKQKAGTVIIFQPERLGNKFEERVAVYSGAPTTSGMKSWVERDLHGLVGHRTSGNTGQFRRPLVVAFYQVDYVKNPKGSNYWRNRVLKVAKKFSDKDVNFAVASSSDFQHELGEMGLEASDDKPRVGAWNAAGSKFPMETDFSVDNLENFVVDFLAGKLEPYLKSEPIPTEDEDDVKVVVAKNFDDVVNDKSKDVLIEFYAPWCGHCKNLAPKYSELATKLKDESDIVIAKMDATANDVPQPYQVSGFPTLYFAPKNGKSSPKRYEGGREVDDFVKYLARESTDQLKGFDRKGKKVKKSKKEPKKEL